MSEVARRVRVEYDELATFYDRRWASYVTRTLEETLARFQAPEGARVLDLGCGTGAFLGALASARPDLRLVGADLSPGMLAAARRRLGGAVPLVEASALALPFGGGAFDVVTSLSSLHYWPEPGRGLAEVARVLAPGGTLVLTDWCDDYLACRLCAAYLRWTGRPHFRVFGSAGLREALAEAGLGEVRLERYRVSWLWGLMTGVTRRPA